MRRKFKMLFTILISAMILIQATTAFAEPQLQYIEYWKDGTAYNSRGEVITDCTAYDYLTYNADKFVSLNADGKETARAAAPDELSDDGTKPLGTVELHAVVPNSIDNAVEVVLWDRDGNSYTLTAYKDNNYISYANIPQGTYSVFSAGIKDDFKGEYPAKCDKTEITIEPSAASRLEVTVSEKQDLTDPRAYMGNSGDDGIMPIAQTPEPTDAPSLISEETGSLLKSTIITLSVLAVLLLSYYLVKRYRDRKNKRGE